MEPRDVRGAIVKVSPRLTVSESRAIDVSAIRDAYTVAGAVAVVVRPRIVRDAEEIREPETPQTGNFVAKIRDRVSEWSDGEVRDVALRIVDEIMGSGIGSSAVAS